jgi:NADPH:quinone reductase-like Zn-dependent oxidoreductase
VRVAPAEELGGIGSVKLGVLPDPVPAAGQVLVRVHSAGVGPRDVGFLGGGFPGVAVPFVPGQEGAGVVEAAGDGAGVRPGERVYAVLFPAGAGSPSWRWRRRTGWPRCPAGRAFRRRPGW